MQVSINEACRLLNLSEPIIYRLIRKKAIPAYQINKSYLFNKMELLEWAISNNYSVSPEALSALSGPMKKLPGIALSLQSGGVHFNLEGSTKEDVLRAIVSRIPPTASPDLNTDSIFSALIARETIGSTGIGNGIAIPHVRNPIVLDLEQPVILLCFLKKPIDFDAIDNKPVDTFFTLLSSTVRIHLHLLARLSFLLQNSRVQQSLHERISAEEILDSFDRTEKALIKSKGLGMAGDNV